MGSLLEGYYDYYSLTFLEKRKAFLNSILNICNFETEKIPIKDPMARYWALHMEGHKDYWLNWWPEFKVYNLHKDETGEYVGVHEDDAGEYYNGMNFNKNWNTRDILLSEAIIEIEGKDFITNLKGTWDTCLNLIKYKIHYAVFYAEGMRSPHIHTYDLFNDVLDWAEKEMAMNLFINKIVSIEYRHLVDRNLCGQHTIALEFAKHWKTGNIKKLLFEHIPEVIQ